MSNEARALYKLRALLLGARVDGNPRYFFCGIGGSGMLPLALLVQAGGGLVEGSDRSLDQGGASPKFDFLRARGIRLFPQDGSGVSASDQILVASAAVEETIPDVQAARRVGATTMTRAQLLAELFNAASNRVGIAGTSGKSTTTGMLGWILHAAGRKPTIMNGAVMKNFITPDIPFASALVGDRDLFVSEVDESDGSIALFSPTIAVLNNIALDHKSMEELRRLFSDFVGKAAIAVLNLDNVESAALAVTLPASRLRTYSLTDRNADLCAQDVRPEADGISFTLIDRADAARFSLRLQTPGRHNVANGLAALSAARALGVPLSEAARALESFAGIRRRLERVGAAGGVIIFDDFAHNPDKIAASLATLRTFPGRLLTMFQPHGFGSLTLTKTALIETFASGLGPDDVLLMPPPVYFGGTVDRKVGSEDIIDGVRTAGRAAYFLPDRAACGERLLALARPGDRIVVMGARDDTLSQFASELLAGIVAKAG